MWKMSGSLIVTALVTIVAGAEPQTGNDNSWLHSLQYPRPARSVSTSEWVSPAWHPDNGPPASPSHQQWPSENEDREGASWEQQESLNADRRFDPLGNLGDAFENPDEEAILELLQQQESPQLAKRQPPRRLGSLVDLYKDIAHGLSPFVANAENELLPTKPERRSGRRPAACRFGPFGLVCWNAARRGAVMRQRSAQYTQ